MRFALLMAVREMRASWRRLLFFFACVALGVATIVALRSVIQSVRAGIVGEARTLLAADVALFTNRPWDESTRRVIDSRLAIPEVRERNETVETATMARPAIERRPIARMVELRGVQPGFPLYGTLKLADGRPYSFDLLRGGGTIVRPELLAQLDVKVGDDVLFGGKPFRIRGVVVEEPGSRSGPFSLGSRALVAYDDLRAASLLTFGSRARYAVLVRVEGESAARGLVERLRADFKGRFVNVRWYRATEEDIGEELQRAENYLSLVGLAMVVLGGVGVWSVTRVFVQQKLRSIAVLKCLGATNRQVLATYLVQVIALALAGSALGVLVAAAAIAAIPASLAESLGADSYGLTASAVVQGIAVGLLVSLLFALVPLLDVRKIKPLLVLREATVQADGRGWRDRQSRWWQRIDWPRTITIGVVSIALAAVAGWQAGSGRVGVIVTLALAAVGLILMGAGALVVRAVAPLSWSRRFAVRHAVVNLRRPGNQTRVILLAVGLGAFFVIGVRVIQTNLLREISIKLGEDAPDMFLVDVQQDQTTGVRNLLRERIGVEPKLVPVLRARIVGVRGREVNLDGYEDVRGRGSLAREYVITYRDQLESNETLLEGTMWKPEAAAAEVSMEQGIRERFGIQVGDEIRFDVMGRVLPVKVTSIRRVDWDNARSGGFMFVFTPATFAGAPHAYLGFVKAPGDPDRRARMQRDLVASFPNVSVIDIREILGRAKSVIDNVSLAISIVGLVALAGGALILAGAVAMTRFQRVYEAAILRTLGATSRLLAKMLAFEYGLLGLLAGLVGSGGAAVLGWAAARYLLDMPWSPAPGINLAGVAITAALVCAIGVGASLEVLRRKPLSTLRAE